MCRKRAFRWSVVRAGTIALAACAAAAGIAQTPAAPASSAPPAATAAPPAAAGAPVALRIVGGLAGVNQYTRHEEPFWARELPRLSNGQASAEIVPFDRAGIRGQEMLRLVQLGTVPFGTALLTISAAQDPELSAPDLPGLNPDLAALRRSVDVFRPYLATRLHERYDIELLATYVYPGQVTFCTRPLSGLADLSGRRVRVSNPAQADWVRGLGATPVQTGFAEIVPTLRSGGIDCAITGSMSGNTIGLHEVTRYVHVMPVSWGLAAFVANGAAWRALPVGVQAMLRRELPRLEQAIWLESAQETGEGIACNVGADACRSGRRGSMKAVPATPDDERLRREVLTRHVLPGWLQRCGPGCAPMWRQTLGPATGVNLE